MGFNFRTDARHACLGHPTAMLPPTNCKLPLACRSDVYPACRTGEATVADNVRFHDDKSTFTGVHNSGELTLFYPPLRLRSSLALCCQRVPSAVSIRSQR